MSLLARRNFLLVLAALTVTVIFPHSIPLAWAGAYQDILTAVHLGNREALAELLAKGMDPDTADGDGNTLLMHAAKSGDLPILETLLSYRCSILKNNRFGDNALALASLGGHLEAVERLVAAGAEPDPSGGWTPLLYAAFNGHLPVVAFLLKQGADVDQRAPNGMTPLMLAVRHQNTALAEFLIEADADVDLADYEGITALALARRLSYEPMVRLLLAAGAES